MFDRRSNEVRLRGFLVAVRVYANQQVHLLVSIFFVLFVALGPRPSTERGLWVLATAGRGRRRSLGRVTKETQHSHSLHILVLAGNPPQTTSVFARPPPPFHTFLAAHLRKAFLSGNGVKLLVEPQRMPPLHPILPAAF